MRPTVRRYLLGAALLAVTAACSPSTATPTPRPTATPTPASTKPMASAAPNTVTIDLWDTDLGDPGKTIWQTAANMYMADHPQVSITIEALDAGTFATRMAIAENSNHMPDLFESSGGLDLRALAERGMLRDITSEVAAWSDPASKDINAMNVFAYKGGQYGMPWSMGMTGIFYNKALFTKAGIGGPPTFWSDVIDDVQKLRAAGIVPFAIAGRDGWPAMNLWTYLVLREGGSEALTQMVQTGYWNTDACLKASGDLAALVAENPFQAGYLSAAYGTGEAAIFGNGQAAMEVMGEWGPSTQQSMSADGKGLGDNLGWSPFPLVSGGSGRATDGVGSASGVAVGKGASPEAVDFLHFLASPRIMKEIGSSGMGLPTTIEAVASVGDPILQRLVTDRNQARSMQLYLNMVTPPAVGKAIEDQVAGLLGARFNPQQVCQTIAAAAARR